MGLKPIIPRFKPFDGAKFEREIDKAVNKTLDIGKGLFSKTTRSWDHKVVFVVYPSIGGDGAVGTNDPIYGYVTRGTKPHTITPVKAPFLVFPGGRYVPKTNPGLISSRSKGTGSRGTLVRAKRVEHPGTKARGFEEEIAKRLTPILAVNVQAAILKASM